MKKRGIFKGVAGMLLLAMVLSTVLPVFKTTASAEAVWPEGVSLSDGDESAVVMDVATGTVLYSKNGDVVHYPASITKVMTALLAVENGDLSSTVTYSKNAIYDVEAGSSSIARDVGEELTLEQVLYAVMLESCNSSAYATAEHIAGTKDAFVDMMNERAKELGCTNTHFNNPHGLPDENHTTTAHDMAIIACEAYRNPKFATITGTKKYQIPPTNKHSDITYLNNHHSMLNYYKTNEYLYEYCVGGKTGYTTAARSTLVTYAKKDKMTLCCVVMNANKPAHYVDTRRLFDYCFENFSVYDTTENKDLFDISNEADTGLLSDRDGIISIGDGVVILPAGAEFTDSVRTVVPAEDPDNPDLIGKVVYTYGDKTVGSVDLLFTAEPVVEEELPFLNTSEDPEVKDSYVEVDYKKILTRVLIAVAAIALIILIISRFDKILLWKHRTFPTRKKTKGDLPTIKRRRGKRRRRRR